MNIYLIGYRCTGKTEVGRRLARKLNWDFADSDRLFVRKAGMNISDYIEKYGWSPFREAEAEILLELSARPRQIVATGGGVVLRSDNVSCMQASGVVVWLKAEPETVMMRMKADRRSKAFRPALSDDPIEKEVHRTILERTPIYRQSCHMKIATDDKNMNQVCEAITDHLRKSHARKYIWEAF